ncbi:lysozyme-like [Spodoptera litura]|uniref:lysozyme n=1 Tax=Spodoptera litura TaxID=69820 RepID=A0A9J7E7I9_SPOLT|nr:lysozyme-like [Spodoptera litura]XP_022822579.1 lysozyme-like [Spodoptera litura]
MHIKPMLAVPVCLVAVFVFWITGSSAWSDCARSYHCAKRIIEGYLQRFGKDCNGDGVTNCYDYMMVNGNGGYGCTAPLNRSENGRKWLRRYEECRL